MTNFTPEHYGISSTKISEYIKILEDNELCTHNLIIARGNDTVYENYWFPFNAAFRHRMYSISKSIVAIAVGFAEQDGLIDLDEKISTYFPEECKEQKDPNFLNTTVRDMLMMATSKPDRDWFSARIPDRVKFYFENNNPSIPSGKLFRYDSTGSFVIGALVERVSGKKLQDYLSEKLFEKLGIEGTRFLMCPGGHSWGDSGFLCTARDMLKIARFTMNYGTWNGERLLNENYLRTAVSKLIDNDEGNDGQHDCQGYGYYIWRTYENSFFFNGMGCQFAVCVPNKDIIMIYNGDNQGKTYAKKVIIDNFFKLIVDSAADTPLTENAEACSNLKTLSDMSVLSFVKGPASSEIAERISGKTYILNDNPMGIKNMKFTFGGNEGKLDYENSQGNKTWLFNFGENEFFLFPQDGYSDEVGSCKGNGRYRAAGSAAWVEESKLNVRIQVIDNYFGNINAVFAFGENDITVSMIKNAEDFLKEYQGIAYGIEGCE